VYAKNLGSLGFRLPTSPGDGAYERFTGDSAIPGKGEILIWRPRAS
jgi:hypothetical protein